MFTDTLGFEYKATVVAYLLNTFHSDLPSYREAAIQIEKFKRMADQFQKRFPAEMILSVPKKKLDKTRGEHRHRLNQQSKIVDRLIRNLMEESVIRDFGNSPGGRVTPRKVRSQMQKLMEETNRKIHQTFQQVLRESYAAASTALSGSETKNVASKREKPVAL